MIAPSERTGRLEGQSPFGRFSKRGTPLTLTRGLDIVLAMLDAGVVLSIVALLISLASAVFSLLQWNVARQSAKASERSASAAEHSAKTASEGLQVSQRAYVVLESIERIEFFEEIPCRITYRLINKGASPALELATRHKLVLVEEKLTVPDHTGGTDQFYGILGPDLVDPLVYDAKLTSEQSQMLKNETLFLQIHGIAKYKDCLLYTSRCV